jgi:hypothetical protein
MEARESTTVRAQQIEAVEKALRVFVTTNQAVELRALHVAGRRAVCQIFGELHELAAKAAELDAAGARGVYFTPNPLRPDLIGGYSSARDEAVIRRRWLLIDCDPIRPADVSSTTAERDAAWSVMDMAAATLRAWGLTGFVLGDSGNGYHLCYPIDLPNDEPSKQLLKAFLNALSAHCSDTLTAADRQAVKEGQPLAPAKAKIDASVYNAARIWKVYGTRPKKGEHTFERPQRWAQLMDGPAWSAETAQVNNQALPRVLDVLNRIIECRRGRPETNEQTYAAAALRQECQAVSTAVVGRRNNQLFKSAAALAELVAAGSLSRGNVEEALATAAKSAGLEDAEIAATIKSGFNHGMQKPRDLSGLGASSDGQQANPKSERPKISTDNIATIDDLIAAGAKVDWVWPDWIQSGVLTAIAAKGGTGKTRFCADLLRRIRYNKGWPDRAAIAIPSDALSLWVVSDNHHDEMVALSQAFGIKDSIRLNAYKADPYGGVCLDERQDLTDLEARIAIVRPLLVVIDTVGNATDRNLCKQEEAKAFYWPLQILARKYRTAILCLTHLNADGHFLGRRVLEKVRVAIRMEQPDESNDRRRLEVVKSNAKRPPALGVTMGDLGNEYDTNPPQRMEHEVRCGPGRPPEKFHAAAAWLTGDWLKHMAKRVGHTRSEGELRGYSAKTLYAVLKAGLVEEFEDDKGKKWWRLPEAKKSSGNIVS